MKRLKKYFSIVFIMVLLFAFKSTAFASDTWSTNGQKVVPASSGDNIEEISLAYEGKQRIGKIDYLVFNLTYNGQVYKYNDIKLRNPNQSGGWSHLLLKLDEDLTNKVDFFRSYAKGDYSHRLDNDYSNLTSNFSTEKSVFFLRFSQIFKVNTGNHNAKIYLATKRGRNIEDSEVHSIWTRVARKTRDTGWKFFLIQYQLRAFNENFKVSSNQDGNFNDFTKKIDFIVKSKDDKFIPKSPSVDEIFTKSKQITGETNYPETERVRIFVNNKDMGLANLVDGKFSYDISGLTEKLKKDDKITIKNERTGYTSNEISTVVKASINFHYETDNGEVNKEITVPKNRYDRTDKENYKGNGFDVDMFKPPEVKDKRFIGWATSEKFDGSFELLKKLGRTEDLKDDGKAYKFTEDTIVDDCISVYAVYESELGIKVVLHVNGGKINTNAKYGNKVVDDTLTLNMPYGVLADYYKIQELNTYDEQRNIANIEYPEAILPDMYTYKLLKAEKSNVTPTIENKVFYNDGHTFVGWSTKKDNSEMPIEGYYKDEKKKYDYTEGLFENMAIISHKKDDFDKHELYITTIETDGKDFAQSVTMKRKVRRIYPKNGEIHLYAAWKPEYTINLTDGWFKPPVDENALAEKNKGTIKDWINILYRDANKKDQYRYKKKNQIFNPKVSIGLLYRTAVTEAERPTVTSAANYYTIAGSVKQSSERRDNKYTWHYPAYDEHGKRLSFIAVVLPEGEDGYRKYEEFNQVWSNIWISAEDNTANPDRWKEENIAKTQLISSKDTDGDIDAFTGATIRTWKDSEAKVIINGKEETRQKPKVGVTGEYNFTFIGISSPILSPQIKIPIGGTNFFEILRTNDNRVTAFEINLPEHIQRPIYLYRKAYDEWIVGKKDTDGRIVPNDLSPYEENIVRRIKLNMEKEDENDPNSRVYLRVTLLDVNGRDPLGNLDGSNSFDIPVNNEGIKITDPAKKQEEQSKADPLATFRIGQTLKVRALNKDDPNIKSLVSLVQFIKMQESASLRNLRQEDIIQRDGKEYVVLSGDKPTEDLGLLSDVAIITLMKKNGEIYEPIKDSSGQNIIGVMKGNKYYFEVEKSLLADGDELTVSNKDGNKEPTLYDGLLRIDLTAPEAITQQVVMDKSNLIYKNAIKVKDGEKNVSISVEENSGKFDIIKDSNTDSWTISGVNIEAGNYEIKFRLKDRYSNKSELYTLKVKVGDESSNINSISVKQTNSLDDAYVIELTNPSGFKKGDKITVMSNNGTIITTSDIAIDSTDDKININVPKSAKNKIELPLKIIFKRNIVDNINMLNIFDMEGPGEVTINTENLRKDNKIIEILNIPQDAIKLEVDLGIIGKKTIIKDGDSWKTESGELVSQVDGKYQIVFDKSIPEFTNIRVKAYDNLNNVSESIDVMRALKRPNKPISISATVEQDSRTQVIIIVYDEYTKKQDSEYFIKTKRPDDIEKIVITGRTIEGNEFSKEMSMSDVNEQGFIEQFAIEEELTGKVYVHVINDKGVESEKVPAEVRTEKKSESKPIDTGAGIFNTIIKDLKIVPVEYNGERIVKVTGTVENLIGKLYIRVSAWDWTYQDIEVTSGQIEDYFHYDDPQVDDDIEVEIYDANGKIHDYYYDKEKNEFINRYSSEGVEREDIPKNYGKKIVKVTN